MVERLLESCSQIRTIRTKLDGLVEVVKRVEKVKSTDLFPGSVPVIRDR